MSTPELVAQVRAALAKIPHEAWCGDHGYGLTWHSCDCLYEMRCSCDREARIAEAVARAIQVAAASGMMGIDKIPTVFDYAYPGYTVHCDRALQALGASPQPETR